jgi:hypothetical protein
MEEIRITGERGITAHVLNTQNTVVVLRRGV